MTQPPQVWTSLEIVKLAVSLLTPVALLLLGIWVTRLAEQFKAVLWANQKVIEKRISIYDEMAPLLNDLYCYFTFVGHWKELTPPEVVAIKRKLDKNIYINAPLFSADFRTAHFGFIHRCFETYVGPGLDAKLRTPISTQDGDRPRAAPGGWKDSWDSMFSDLTEWSSRVEIEEAYANLMSCFASELGIGLRRAGNTSHAR